MNHKVKKQTNITHYGLIDFTVIHTRLVIHKIVLIVSLCLSVLLPTSCPALQPPSGRSFTAELPLRYEKCFNYSYKRDAFKPRAAAIFIPACLIRLGLEINSF